jgi:hypothetical protein
MRSKLIRINDSAERCDIRFRGSRISSFFVSEIARIFHFVVKEDVERDILAGENGHTPGAKALFFLWLQRGQA